jgi:O-antigen ligase
MLMDFPLFALILLSIFAPEGRFRWSFPGIGVAALLFLGWTLFTCFTATNEAWAISEWTRFFRGFLLFLCVANYTNSSERLRAVLFATLGSFAFQALLGTYQWRYGPLGLTILEEQGHAWRAAGTFEHPGVYADYLILLLPLLVRLFMFHRNVDKRYTYAYLALLVFGACGLLGSYGRGPWLAFAGAMGVMMFYSLTQRKLRPRTKIPIFVMALAGIAFAIQYSDTILDQFISEDRKSSSEIRKPLNNIALRMANDHAALGVGLGCYRLASLPYARIEYDDSLGIPLYQLSQIAHNSYLLLACETGLAGVILFLFFILCALKMGRRALKLKSSLISNLSLGLMTGLVGFGVSILTGPNVMNHQLISMTWLFAGWLTAMSRLKISVPAARTTALPGELDPKNLQMPNDPGMLDLTRFQDTRQ